MPTLASVSPGTQQTMSLWILKEAYLATTGTYVTQIATSKRWQCCDLDSEEIFLMHGFSFTESRSVLAETSLVNRPTFISDTSNDSLQQMHIWELYFITIFICHES